MNRKHLFWLIPSCLVVGLVVGLFVASAGMAFVMNNYPVVSCIMEMDNSLNVDGNILPFTVESQREAIQWRCAKEYINFSITDYEDIFVMR